ncbi:MAG: MFS transporter [Prosthecobacter sp.]|nr:MFS transporter [Prosthecobacter sp.]
MNTPASAKSQRLWLAIAGGFAAWLFAGVQMAIMPVASRAASRELLSVKFSEHDAGSWFAYYTVAFLLGGAVGGWLFGVLGDRYGRVRALGGSVLCYSLFAGAGAFASSQEELLVMRFLASLGIGGVWPNCMSLAAESYPNTSRPRLAGILGCASNVGVALMGAFGLLYPINAASWRGVMLWSAAPGIFGLLILWLVPESARWLQNRGRAKAEGVVEKPRVFRGPLLKTTLAGIALGTVPLLGAWGAGKWLFPWADSFSGELGDSFKGYAQFLWGAGASIGSFFGGYLARMMGRRASYAAISLASLIVNWSIFRFMTPASDGFLGMVFLLGVVSTAFFGWLPLFLPELFPTHARATGSGVCYNFGRILSAAGVLGAGAMMGAFGDYSRVGMAVSSVYAIGILVAFLAPKDKTAILKD